MSISDFKKPQPIHNETTVSDKEWSNSSTKVTQNRYSRISSNDRNNGNDKTFDRTYNRTINKNNNTSRYKDRNKNIRHKDKKSHRRYKSKTTTNFKCTPTVRSEGSWEPRSLSNSRSNSRSNSPTGNLDIKNIQGYLNKITTHTFESLSVKIIEICQDNNELLTKIIDCIFEQALLQPAFCKIYASLCHKMHSEITGFRKGLLIKCQNEFERGSKEPPDDLLDQALEIFIYKAKIRMLGNIKFIGELFLTKVLVVPVIYECFDRLLDLTTNNPNNPDEEQTEALCSLIINVGESIDDELSGDKVSEYFEKMQNIKHGGKLKPRLKYKIEDIVDLRNNKWSSVK